MDLEVIFKNFLNEIIQAEGKNKTSLPFIVQQLPDKPIPHEEETFQVMTIGGSVFRGALVKKTKEGVQILNQVEEAQPIFGQGDELLEFILEHLLPDIRVLAINFAYPLNPVFQEGKLDGVLLSGSKEHRFSGLIGKTVGEEVEKYLKQKLNRQILVTIANDTVCLLLSGLTKYMYNQLAAGIVGTGVNFAFFLGPDKVVNLESGNFDKFEQLTTRQFIDQSSSSPGTALFEKEVSGAYLYQHYNVAMQSQPGFKLLTSSLELDQLARASDSPLSMEARRLIKRSAQLVATQVAGITAHKGGDMTFVMEGSLFWKGYDYQEMVKQTVKELAPQFKVEFVHINDSSLLGAAELAI